MSTRVRLLAASVVLLAIAAASYAIIASVPQRVSVGVYVLNRSGMELRDVRVEFHGTTLAAPAAESLVRITQEYGYSTETSGAIPSKVIVSAVTPEGGRRHGELYPRRVVGRDRFLDGQDMRIEIQPLLGLDVLFSRRGRAEQSLAAESR